MMHAAGFIGDALRWPLVEVQHFFGWLQSEPADAAHAAVVDDVLAAFIDDPDADAFRAGWVLGTALYVAAAALNSGGLLERMVARAKRCAADGPDAASCFDIDAPPADCCDQTPLVTAVHWGHEASVRVLLHAGADPLRRNHLGQHAFRMAVIRSNMALVEMMLSEYPIIKDDLDTHLDGEPVLVVAMKRTLPYGNVDYHRDGDSVECASIVRLLLAAGADPFGATWVTGSAVACTDDTQRLADNTRDAGIIAAIAAARDSKRRETA
jgi:hypothetical protein